MKYQISIIFGLLQSVRIKSSSQVQHLCVRNTSAQHLDESSNYYREPQ